MTDYQFQAAVYAEELCGLLAEPENIEAIDGIFEADLVRSQSFEVIGEDKNVIVLRDASGFDVLSTVTCEEITEARTAAIDAARLARGEADDEPPVDGETGLPAGQLPARRALPGAGRCLAAPGQRAGPSLCSPDRGDPGPGSGPGRSR
jgi:hypothetical protein